MKPQQQTQTVEKLYSYPLFDPRTVKCACDMPRCRQTGISIEENQLFFYSLEKGKLGTPVEVRRSMILDKATRDQLIQELKQIKFQTN